MDPAPEEGFEITPLRRLFVRFLYYAYTVFQFFYRPVTVGVRVMLVRDGQVLLIRHSYLRGWYLPGGGLKRGESMEAAARREVREEAGAQAGPLTLLGVYSRLERIKSDHNVVFLCTEFEWDGRHDAEVAEVRFFPLTALPGDTRAGHRRRIEQYARGEAAPSSGLW